MYTMRTAINRSHVERRPSRRWIYPIDDPAHDRVLLLFMRSISGQTMQEPIDIIRCSREVHKPRE